MTHGGLLPHGDRQRGNGTPIACGRSPTGTAPIDNTTFYATLIINSNIGHGEYMQPGWFFCVNCHGRYLAGDAPNGLAGVGPVPSAGRGTAPPRTPHWPGGLNYGLRPPQGTVAGNHRQTEWFRCSQCVALCFNPPNGIHGAPAPNFGGRDSQMAPTVHTTSPPCRYITNPGRPAGGEQHAG
jgi:hypothetical protein